MRIDEIVSYHGSTAARPSNFQRYHAGNNSHTFGPYQSTRWGIFFSNNPEFSRLYGAVGEYDLNLQNTADLDLYGGELISRFTRTIDAHDPERRDIWLAAMYHQHVWQMFDDEVGKAFTKFLRRQGYDSASFKEYNEDDHGNEIESKSIVVFSPRRIRRVK